MKLHALRAIALASLCALAVGSISGCTATASAGPAPNIILQGRVVFRWTINGSTDPNVCVQSSAQNIDIRVLYADGSLEGEYVANCDAFGTTIDLPEGHYSATAELRDVGNNPRTTSIDVNPFDVQAGSDLNIPLDFPSSSFM